ncbi:unnamed protein product [Scytosiphon promiscuus]
MFRSFPAAVISEPNLCIISLLSFPAAVISERNLFIISPRSARPPNISELKYCRIVASSVFSARKEQGKVDKKSTHTRRF